MVIEYVASYLSWTNLFGGFSLCESSTLIRWLLSPINIRYFTLLLELWFIAVNDCFPNFGEITCVVSLDDHSLSFLKSLAVLILLVLFIETLIFFLLGRIIETTKGKRLIFETIFKSKLSYGIEPLIKHDSKYKVKWESILYRVLKGIFGINCNISKAKVLGIMGVWNKENINFIDRLTPNAVKLKLGCLFNKYSKIKPWDWDKVHNYNHWIIEWKKSERWRCKWDNIWLKELGRTVADVLKKDYKIKRNQIRVAKILNEATAELITTIRGM